MYWLSYAFSPSGRFRRLDWHFTWLSIALIEVIFGCLYLAAPGAGTKLLTSVIGLVGNIITIIASVKRFHDLGKSGWYILAGTGIAIVGIVLMMLSMGMIGMIVVIIGALYALFLSVQLAFFSGQPLDNEYGPSPYNDNPLQLNHALMVWGILAVFAGGAFYAGGSAAYMTAMLQMKETTQAEQAVAAMPVVVAPPTAEELREQAEAARKKAEEKFASLQGLAQQGHAESQYQLASHYMAGDGVARSDTDAAVWLGKAAQQGHVQAQYNLGVLYALGKGVPADYARACFWLTRAAENGFVPTDRTDYRALAASHLTPEMVTAIEERAKAWKPGD